MTTTTTTTTQFEEALANFSKLMLESYDVTQLSEEERGAIADTIECAHNLAIESFQPYFRQLVAQLNSQRQQLEHLKSEKTEQVSVPTLEWVAQNRKTAKTGDLTGFNIFAMVYSDTFKAGRPPAGLWDEYDQEPWKKLARLYNSLHSTKKVATAISTAVSTAVSTAAPISAGEITVVKPGLTPYMYWSMQYTKEHGHRPTKGEWAKVPITTVNDLKSKLATIKAQQA